MHEKRQAEVWMDAGCTLAEGPVWCRGQLHWVDIDGGKLYRARPGQKEQESWDVGGKIGAAVPAADGRWLLALERGLAWFSPDTGEILHAVDFPEPERHGTRFNDGKCDPVGRFWVGTMSMRKEQGAGSLYRLGRAMRLERMMDGVTTSNGLAWTADGKILYYIDTPTRRIDAFDYDLQQGTIANRRTVIDLQGEAGRPDGMAIDRAGMLWVAMWAGWGVLGIDPIRGAVRARIDVPVEKVTSCCFGGSDLCDLFITTARGEGEGVLPDQPHAGGVFRIRMDDPGRPVVPVSTVSTPPNAPESG